MRVCGTGWEKASFQEANFLGSGVVVAMLVGFLGGLCVVGRNVGVGGAQWSN